MKTDQAVDHLQTIRTLMERTALYRRALGPIMLFNAVLGMAGAAGGYFLKIDTVPGFIFCWVGVAIVGLLGSFMLVRRQALRDSEPFWSPPTRRVAQALAPGFLVGAILPVPFLICERSDNVSVWLPVVWIVLYGLALHAAGFFMPRGIRLFGWGFVLCGLALFIGGTCWPRFIGSGQQSHLLMGIVFGGLHLAYGLYLLLTEQPKRTP